MNSFFNINRENQVKLLNGDGSLPALHGLSLICHSYPHERSTRYPAEKHEPDATRPCENAYIFFLILLFSYEGLVAIFYRPSLSPASPLPTPKRQNRGGGVGGQKYYNSCNFFHNFRGWGGVVCQQQRHLIIACSTQTRYKQ